MAKEAKTYRNKNFNPRSPHGERLLLPDTTFHMAHFNPRSPHGERLCREPYCHFIFRISIHAPRTGSDALDTKQLLTLGQFQSTLPARGATLNPREDNGRVIISIHAPRTGSDPVKPIGQPTISISIHAPRTGSDIDCGRMGGKNQHFNPRSPHGERPRS